MNSLSSENFQDILYKLEQATLSQDEWHQAIPLLEYDQTRIILDHVTKTLAKNSDPHYTYIQKLLFYDQDEDRLTEIIEVLFETLADKDTIPDWFVTLSTEFLEWTTSELIVENYFLFLGQYHQQQPLQYDSQFIQSLEHISSSNVRFSLLCFVSEQNLHVYENTDILQLFFDVSVELKLKFIPIISDFSKEKRIALSKSILRNDSVQKEPLIILSILFHMVQDLKGIFETYDRFTTCIENLGDDKNYELLYSEYTKPKAVVYEWVQHLLLDNLIQNTRHASFIIESSGEHMEDWPDKFREAFLQVAMTGDTELQVSVAKMLSPLWFDEQIIDHLLQNTDEKVREALFESLIQLYQELSSELQQKVQTLFQEEKDYENYLGLLWGYNFQVAAFHDEVQAALEDFANKEKEEILSGIVLGLGMQWNAIDEAFKKLIQENHPKMSKKVIKELVKGMEMIYVTLGVEGMNFITELQSYDYQISPDDIELE